MSDVTHYSRARKWLDDPGTKIPDEVRADLNAALAISTAQRETEKTTGRLVERVADIRTTIERASDATRPHLVPVDATFHVSPAHVASVEAEPAGGSRVHLVSGFAIATAAPLQVVISRLYGGSDPEVDE